MVSSERNTSSFYIRLYRGLLISYVIVVAGFIVAAYWYAVNDRTARLAAATHTMETLVRSLDEHVHRSFDGVNVLLSLLASDMVVDGAFNAVPEVQLHNKLKLWLSLLPQSNSLFVYSPELKLYAGSGSYPVPPVDGNKYGHVTSHITGSPTTLHVGLPHINPVRGSWAIPVTRRISGSNGEFLGIVGAIIDQEHFYDFYQDLGLSDGTGIALIRTDGILLFRFPETEELRPGTDLSNIPPLFDASAPLGARGTFRFVSQLDKVDRILVYRKLFDLGTLVVIALDVTTILAPWRQNTRLIALGVGIAIIVLSLLLVITLRQISRRKEDELKLIAAEEQYRSIVELAPIAVVRLVDGLVQYANPEALRIFGMRDLSHFIGRSPMHYVRADDREILQQRFARLQAGPTENPTGQFHIAPDDGKEILVEGKSMSLQQGDSLVVHAMFRDITLEHQTAEEIRQLNELLEQKVRDRTAELNAVNQELEAFSYSVSHDLRAPLRAIGGFTEILRTDHGDRLDEEAIHLFERVEDGVRRMSALIEALISLGQISRQEIKAGMVDLSALVREVAEDLQEQHSERKVEIRVQEDIQVVADPALLEIVIRNLVSNAYKYTVYTAQARIEFGEEQRGDETVYYLKDNGAGFDMKYAGQLFRPFQRLHSAREFEGTGIGLATVERIIRRHGGRIWVEAAPDQGAVFRFVLPGMLW